jgi:hypothetical protein
MTEKPWLNVFLRVNNRKRYHQPVDLHKAGYPMEILRTRAWAEIHKLCQEHFVDAAGRKTYIWFGEKFFFLNKEDAQLFRTLQLLV